jgi:hypothetical protein
MGNLFRMPWLSPVTVGVACLAAGLLAGYLIPREEPLATANEDSDKLEAIRPNFSQPVPAGSNTNYTVTLPPAAETPTTSSGAATGPSPPAEDDAARRAWLQNLPAADLPQLVSDLCQKAGPGGLSNQDRWLLSSAIGKWWQEDAQGLLAWLKQMPNNRSKRYLLTTLLKQVGSRDPSQATALAETFKADDPDWDTGKLLDSFVGREVDRAWERPGVTAEEMLALYSRYSRGSNCSGPYMRAYPPNFDFRKFLDGIASLNRQDGKSPARMPSDILAAWATLDPQAAAQWFLQYEASKEENGKIPFVEWRDIMSGITQRSGPQAYLQWAAGVVVQGNGELREMILRESNDPQLAGIVGQIPDAATRDSVLAEAIATSRAYGGNNLGRLRLVSTPKARLQIIAENASSFYSLIERGKTDPSLWPRVGLTTQQVDAALGRDKPRN